MNDILDYPFLTCESEANQRSEDGGITRSPITFRTSTVALEKLAFVFKANSRVTKFWVKVQECLLSGIYLLTPSNLLWSGVADPRRKRRVQSTPCAKLAQNYGIESNTIGV